MSTALIVFFATWWFTHFEPLQDFLSRYYRPGKWTNKILDALSCWTCTAFWASLVIFLSFPVACALSFAAWATTKITR